MVKRLIDETIQEITAFGGPIFYGFLMLYTLIEKRWDATFFLAVAILLSYLTIIIIRSFYFKPRPKKKKFKNWIEKLDASSFPSHHSLRAMVLIIFAMQFMGGYFVPLFAVLAVLIWFSRFYLKKHDPWDILGGAIAGIIIGFIAIAITENVLFSPWS